jgi:hypothetical protein
MQSVKSREREIIAGYVVPSDPTIALTGGIVKRGGGVGVMTDRFRFIVIAFRAEVRVAHTKGARSQQPSRKG